MNAQLESRRAEGERLRNAALCEAERIRRDAQSDAARMRDAAEVEGPRCARRPPPRPTGWA